MYYQKLDQELYDSSSSDVSINASGPNQQAIQEEADSSSRLTGVRHGSLATLDQIKSKAPLNNENRSFNDILISSSNEYLSLSNLEEMKSKNESVGYIFFFHFNWIRFFFDINHSKSITAIHKMHICCTLTFYWFSCLRLPKRLHNFSYSMEAIRPMMICLHTTLGVVVYFGFDVFQEACSSIYIYENIYCNYLYALSNLL